MSIKFLKELKHSINNLKANYLPGTLTVNPVSTSLCDFFFKFEKSKHYINKGFKN